MLLNTINLFNFINLFNSNFYFQSSWVGASHLISIILLCFIILILGLMLPTKPRYIKFLNFVAAIFVAINLYLSSFNIPFIISETGENYIWYTQNYSSFINLFKIVASVTVCLFLLSICDRFYIEENRKLEFPLLILFTHLSGLLLLNSVDFLSTIISLECLAFCSYILVGFERKNKFSSSSGIKYLILGSIPGGFFILGVSLFYKNYGTFSQENLETILNSFFTMPNSATETLPSKVDIKYAAYKNAVSFVENWNMTKEYIEQLINEVDIHGRPGCSKDEKGVWHVDNFEEFKTMVIYRETYVQEHLLTARLHDLAVKKDNLVNSCVYTSIFLSSHIAIFFILVNLLFKLTAAPFHSWAPSIYGGSPLPTVTFLSVFSKVTIIFFMIYLLRDVFLILYQTYQPILLFCGVLSIICGIIGAFSEKLIKRFFVYSSMGHVGFMILGIASLNIVGLKGTINYLLIYIISAFILWFILMFLTKKVTHLTSLKALCVNHPVLSFIFSLVMFSLSGIPPLGGFFVKFEIFYSIILAGKFYLAYTLFFLTVISFFYYLRIIKIIYFENTKIFKKDKNMNEMKLRLLSILFHIVLGFILFAQQPILFILGEYLNSL